MVPTHLEYVFLNESWNYPLVNIQKTMEDPPFLMGKLTINGHFQLLFWHNQRVAATERSRFAVAKHLNIFSVMLFASYTGWWWLEHGWIMTFHMLGMEKSSQLTQSIIFQRGRYTTNQLFTSYRYIHIYIYHSISCYIPLYTTNFPPGHGHTATWTSQGDIVVKSMVCCKDGLSELWKWNDPLTIKYH